MVRVISDVGMLQDVAVTALLPLAAKILLVAGVSALMYALNWKLALLAFSVLPLFWLRTVTLTRRIQEVAKKQRRQEELPGSTHQLARRYLGDLASARDHAGPAQAYIKEQYGIGRIGSAWAECLSAYS